MRIPKNVAEAEDMIHRFFKTYNYTSSPVPLRECEIDGKRMRFDYTSPGLVAKLIEFYHDCEYLGSDTRAWYDGNLVEFDELHHFFVRK